MPSNSAESGWPFSPILLLTFVPMYLAEYALRAGEKAREQRAEEERKAKAASGKKDGLEDSTMPDTEPPSLVLGLHGQSWVIFGACMFALLLYRIMRFLASMHLANDAVLEFGHAIILPWALHRSPRILFHFHMEHRRYERCMKGFRKWEKEHVHELAVASKSRTSSSRFAKSVEAIEDVVLDGSQMNDKFGPRIAKGRCEKASETVPSLLDDALPLLNRDLAFNIALQVVLPQLHRDSASQSCEEIHWQKACCEGRCIPRPKAMQDALEKPSKHLFDFVRIGIYRILSRGGARHLDGAVRFTHLIGGIDGFDLTGERLMAAAAAVAVLSASYTMATKSAFALSVPLVLMAMLWALVRYYAWRKKKLRAEKIKRNRRRGKAAGSLGGGAPQVGTARAQGWLQDKMEESGELVVTPIPVHVSNIFGGSYMTYHVRFVSKAKGEIPDFQVQKRYSDFLHLDAVLSEDESLSAGTKPRLPPKRFWKNSDLVIGERVELLHGYIGVLIFSKPLFQHPVVQDFLFPSTDKSAEAVKY